LIVRGSNVGATRRFVFKTAEFQEILRVYNRKIN
tara:strand:+ start:986 stop:1087 length:102 start_codon:yes stop_codon:yes gene_type:complete